MISEAPDRTATLADRVASWPHKGTAEYRPAHKGPRAILKLLYSIAAHIETMSVASLEGGCGEYYTLKRADPDRAHSQ
jgi:hypothetical protein